MYNVIITLYSIVSGAESTLKVGVYFNIFPNFLPISESGGVTKSRPIDPIFEGNIWTKSVQIYRFACII